MEETNVLQMTASADADADAAVDVDADVEVDVEVDVEAAEVDAAAGSCHEPVDLVPMGRAEAERVAKALKAVAEPTRLQLLSMIQASPGGEACVCDLTAPLGLTQPTVSHHLKILVDAGLITREKRGTWAWYAIAHGRLESVRALLA